MKQTKFINAEEAKKFWRWKWKQIMRKILAALFIAWAIFSAIGLGVFCEFIGNAPDRISNWYGAFATSLFLFILIIGIIVTLMLLSPDKDD